jgi:Ribbon-helix-helix domain
MEDNALIETATGSPSERPAETIEKNPVVSTHVLVEQEQVELLRELSKRTRVAQSEYLREAVDDLLSKYQKLP